MEMLDDKVVGDFRHGSQGTFLLGLYIVRVASDALSHFQRWIGLVNHRTLEQFNEFSASVEIQDDALALGRSTFGGIHAGNLI